MESGCRKIAGCICMPPTWCAMRTAVTKSSATARRRPPARAIRWRIASCLSRALPSVFRQCNVQRLAPFFVSLRETLAELAPANHENPRIVLLTPGPYNETYFEHSFLARYLGYALVQGNDLTVRDTIVYMKTLGGLQRVDVILRRVDDNFCDPLELLSGFLPRRAGIAAGRSPRECCASPTRSAAAFCRRPGFFLSFRRFAAIFWAKN